MSVELRELRWAIAAAQHHSLRQAAQALRIRQSTLSRRLRDLEGRLGATLFERTNGGTRPTIIGKEFLDAARRIVDETDCIAARLRARSKGESGKLTVGVHASLTAGNLRATLVEHRQRFPDVEIQIVDGSSDHLFSDLINSAIDIAFIAERNTHWHGRFLPVWSERVVVAMPADHPLGQNDVVHWSELKNEEILIPLRGPGPELSNLIVHKIVDPQSRRVVTHDAALDRLLTLVSAGWGLLLAFEGATGLTYPNVIYRELHDRNGSTRLNFRAYWREVNSNPPLGTFLKMLRERYPDLSADIPVA